MVATRLSFEEDLKSLQNRVVEMGRLADQMVEGAIRALEERNVSFANEIIRRDDEVDRMDLEIETQCMKLIALQQPMARDLRTIGTALKIITDIERIGDHSVDIAKIARKLADDPVSRMLVDIPPMAHLVRKMLGDVLQAFVNHDLELVEKVVSADDQADTIYHRLRDELQMMMQKDSRLVIQASNLLLVALYLERIADHSVNIAERVAYVETGVLKQLASSHSPTS